MSQISNLYGCFALLFFVSLLVCGIFAINCEDMLQGGCREVIIFLLNR